MEFILFILFFCGCGGGEFVYFVPFHFFSTAREFPLVTQNTPVGTNASWHGTRIRGHTSRFVTVSFFFFSANQPSSAGIVTFGEQIIKKRNGIKENNGRWEYLSSSFSYSIKWKLLDVSSVAGLSCCYVPFQLYHRWGVPVGRHPSGHAQPTSTSIKEGNKNILFRPTDRVFSPSGLFFFYHENVRMNMLQENNKIRFFKKVRQTRNAN